MPTRKTRTTKKRAAPRRRRTTTTKAVRRVVRKEVARQVESKSYDGRTDAAAISYNGTSWALTSNASAGTSIAQGVGDFQYIGSLVRAAFLHIRGFCVLADTYNYIRLILLQVKGPGSSLPALTDILQSVGNVETPFSSFDRDFDSQYRVLAQRLITLNSAIPTAKFDIKISGKKIRPIHFSDAAGTTAMGGLYLVAFSDSAAAAHPTVSFYHRLTYKDA